VRVGAYGVGLGGLLLLGLLRCPVAFVLRVPCPGCGMTRATLRLLHGDLHGALAFHPLVPMLLPCAVLFFGVNTVMYIRHGDWGYVDRQMGRGITAVAGVMALLAIGVWLARFFGAFGGPVPVLWCWHEETPGAPALDELLLTLVGWVAGSGVAWLLLHVDRRRLDGYGRARMWNGATLAAAISGLFLPPMLALGAHVWVTRRPPWWRRLGLALLAVVVAGALTVLVGNLALWALGVSVPD
jgi:hypothetical protein